MFFLNKFTNIYLLAIITIVSNFIMWFLYNYINNKILLNF